MSILNNSMMMSGGVPFAPLLQLYLDSFDAGSMTKAYQNQVATGTGTSGSTTITASADQTSKMQAGMKLRMKGTDIYTIVSVSTVTITTLETLSQSYAADAMALDRISQWNDKSGLGNHATQATALSRPIYNPVQLNGNSVITFDGANLLSLPSGVFNIPNEAHTVFVVGKRNTASGNQALLNMNVGVSPSNQAWLIQYANTAGNILYQNRALNTSAVTSTSNTTTNFNIIQGDYDGASNINIRINNGTATNNTNSALVSTVDGAAIGATDEGTNNLTGHIGIVLVYKALLTTSGISQVVKWLSRKTAIAVS